MHFETKEALKGMVGHPVVAARVIARYFRGPEPLSKTYTVYSQISRFMDENKYTCAERAKVWRLVRLIDPKDVISVGGYRTYSLFLVTSFTYKNDGSTGTINGYLLRELSSNEMPSRIDVSERQYTHGLGTHAAMEIMKGAAGQIIPGQTCTKKVLDMFIGEEFGTRS